MTGAEDRQQAIIDAFKALCSTHDALLYPGGFRDSGLAVVSAVFSIQATDESVRRVVDRFAQSRRLDGVAALGGPDHYADAYPVERLASELQGMSEEELVDDVFGSEATSPRSGRRKAVIVEEVASALVGAGVRSREDVAMSPSGEVYDLQKKAWTEVRGLGWVTFEYFRLLCGAETAKPDMMIHRWLARVLDEDVDGQTALALLRSLAASLEDEWSQPVSVRAVDHTIWFHESSRAESN